MTRAHILVCGLLAAGLLPRLASAHRFTPGVLSVEPLTPNHWAVAWRPPEPLQPNLHISFSAACQPQTLGPEHWRLRCAPEDLEIAVKGLSHTKAEILVVGPTHAVRVLRGAQDTWHPTLSQPAPRLTTVLIDYGRLGLQHILLGPDHLAFVFGLLLLIRGGRRLLWTLSAFTLAHSLTLAGAVLGWVHLPVPPVEAIIALSIVFVAREAARGAHDRGRTVVLAAGGFGLVHGLGFASALAELGLPEQHVPSALFAFNVGVELGQILVVASAMALGAALEAVSPNTLPRLHRPAAYVLGVTATVWTLERLAVVGGWS